eukprot:scaffold14634_cov61-Phaeocystis_antarctica.AAC.6
MASSSSSPTWLGLGSGSGSGLGLGLGLGLRRVARSPHAQTCRPRRLARRGCGWRPRRAGPSRLDGQRQWNRRLWPRLVPGALANHRALSGTAVPPECGVPPRANSASLRRQGWQEVARSGAAEAAL